MSHKTSSRRTTDLECPLASLGRNSNAVRDQLAAAHYHHPHPLSSSPLDPQAYKMSRKSPNLSLNVNDTVVSGELYPLASRSSTPHTEQQTPATAAAAAAASAAAAATTAAVLHMVQQKAATFELRGRHTRHEQSNYGAHSTASVGRHVQSKKSPELQTLPAPATRTIVPVPQPRNFLTLDWLHGNSADTEDSSDNNAGGGAANGRRRAQVQTGRCSVPTVLGNGNSAQYLLDKKMESLYLGNALRALPLGAEASQYQNERYYLEDYSSGSGNERLPGEHTREIASTQTSVSMASPRELDQREML